MADDSVRTITATFQTRAAADLAIERLAQQHHIARADIFVQPKEKRNSSGTAPSGGDASHSDGRVHAALRGEIEVSADLKQEDIARAEAAFREAGATSLATR
ncbi:hypothetical protein N2599_23815 (plasmid) [Rhizobium sullae]|uniref:Uncharacterized protein n=1 Tax=Rhizobium sullae TaxID=50338 RepID=A0A2N0D815_RHISU|nr:hypothetical protein [Rhizobium sullae]PKA42211.1 hypothetical protein CWR43_19090 [Rhizobium sullae]UWU18279.1 hypothetical protein N2599_23815 [Rhizobium sullae]